MQRLSADTRHAIGWLGDVAQTLSMTKSLDTLIVRDSSVDQLYALVAHNTSDAELDDIV